MKCYSNSTTRRLESYAKARGLVVGVMKSPDNSAGMFFVVNEDGKPLTHWVSLGWTVAESKEAIERMAAA